VTVFQVMGGDLEEDWEGLPDRDWVLVGTQDQLLSRALNGGYCASPHAWPVHFGGEFAVVEGWDARRQLAESFAAFRGPPTTVRLAFRRRAARLVVERQWHPTQVVVPRADGRVEVVMRVLLSVGLRGWVLSWVPEVEVVEPRELRREVVGALGGGAAEAAGEEAPRACNLDDTTVGYGSPVRSGRER
jgi:WYL domain